MDNLKYDKAPCMHTDADKEIARKWLHAVLDDSDQIIDLTGDDDCLDNDRMFPIIERVLHEIADLPRSVELGFMSDQWVAVTASSIVDGVKYKTWVEADCFMLALVKTYELWKTGKYKETT